MQHKVLARKWRPKKFSDLVGQQTTVTVLKNIIATQKLHHAYLLTGTRGIGKTTIARIIAKALNCNNLINNEPCCECNTCLEIDNGRFIDVIEIDAASNTGVDNIREVIENAQYTPTEGHYKVYIIDEVHMLSKSAFNAMLKTLEEPPQHIIFVLATTDPQKLPITVLSRCLQLKLRNLMPHEISDYLAIVLNSEQVQFEIMALEAIAKSANGSMRDALSLTDQAIAFSNNNITYESASQMLGNTDNAIIYQLIDALVNLDGNTIVNISKQIYADGFDLENVLQNLSQCFCEISIIQITGQNNNEQLIKYASTISINNIQLYFEICNLGLEQIKIVNDKYSTFIMTLLRMLAFNLGTDPEKRIVLNRSDSGVLIGDHRNDKFTTAKTEAPVLKKNISEYTDDPLVEPSNTEPSNTEPSNPVAIIKTTDSEIQTVNESIPLAKSPQMPDPSSGIVDTLQITKLQSQSVNSSTGLVDNYEVSSVLSNDLIVDTQSEYSFDGNWIKLVENLSANLKHSAPFLENSELIKYEDYTFHVKIDNRYQSSFSEHTLNEIEMTFRKILSDRISFSYIFSDNLHDTLKEKNIQNKILEQEHAITAINNDEKLSTILSTFSATISAGSIKSLKS